MARVASGMSVEQIQQVGRQVLEKASQGIRYKDLVSRVQSENPKTNPNTIQGALHALSLQGDVLTPSRGLWILKKFAHEELKVTPPDKAQQQKKQKFDEQAYYSPFAKWLKDEEEEVNFSIVVVGGKTFKDKWATPDVIGTYKQQPNDPVRFSSGIDYRGNKGRPKSVRHSLRPSLCVPSFFT